VVSETHTVPGPGKTERNVVGIRILPTFALKSIGFFLTKVGVLTIMSGLFQINPIWNYGPYDLANTIVP
jgi:quinol---cytochrome-c reductase cytochrome b subunit